MGKWTEGLHPRGPDGRFIKKPKPPTPAPNVAARNAARDRLFKALETDVYKQKVTRRAATGTSFLASLTADVVAKGGIASPNIRRLR